MRNCHVSCFPVDNCWELTKWKNENIFFLSHFRWTKIPENASFGLVTTFVYWSTCFYTLYSNILFPFSKVHSFLLTLNCSQILITWKVSWASFYLTTSCQSMVYNNNNNNNNNNINLVTQYENVEDMCSVCKELRTGVDMKSAKSDCELRFFHYLLQVIVMLTLTLTHI